MIYYFSGTGNSLSVANKLATLLHCSTSPMTAAETTDDETVGFVFPVYAWGLPNVVERFIRDNATIASNAKYLFAVMTCGDDMGYADEVLEEALKAKWGKPLDAAFSVHMPNTYVCLPGFDIDSDELAQRKRQETEEALPRIASAINERKSLRSLHRGALPWMKTYVLRPPFNSILVTDKYLHATDACTACATCVRHCPLNNISLDANKHPQWHGNCSGCLGCYHICPQHALHFGSMTQKKGQKK